MSQLVQSIEHAVEAGVKGIIELAEGYLSASPPEDAVPEADGDNAASPAEAPSTPIPIATSVPPTGATSPSSGSDIAPLSLASRIALANDTLVQVTDVASGWIHLQSTYLDSAGGQRRVRSFGLKNVSQSVVDVEVASDLDSQVVFWVADDETPSEASSASSSSTTADIKLSLQVGETKTIYLAFQPNTSQPSTPGQSTPSTDGGFTPRVLAAPSSAELSPVSGGKLPPAATSSSSSTQGSVRSDTISTSAISSNFSLGSAASRKPDPVHRSFSVHGSVLMHATTQASDVLAPPSQQNVTVPFFATVCRSWFTLAVIDPKTGLAAGSQITSGELTVDFGSDNSVNQQVHRDLLLVNRSEIDLVWSPAVLHAPLKDSVWFSLRDLDSENVFGVDTSAEPVPLPALSSRHLRLTMKAMVPVADFTFDFLVSNVHQTSNVVRCRAVGSCESGTQDTLRLINGSTIDYGQIPDGSWAKKLIAAKNIGDRPIDVHFSATPGFEVVFRLAGVAGEDIDEDTPARPPRDKRAEALVRGEALSRTSTREGRSRDASFGSRGAAMETDELFAAVSAATDRDGSLSRPLSRVTSRSSSYKPSRNDPDSDDDDETSQQQEEAPELRPSDNLGDRDIPNQIEELTMRPGTEYRVFAMYRPARDLASAPEIAGALRKSSFKVFLDSAPSSQRARPAQRSRKVVHCSAESCTSIIAIPSGKVIDFGEVTVGASKSTTISIQNLSALSARVEIAAISKVLNTNHNVIIIPPYETVQERLDFFPRRINDRYEKQVFVRNHLNKANNQLIEVRSKNVDVYNVTLHSHLYRILTPSGSNFLDFGSVVINSPSVRTVLFQNLTRKPLTLEVAASQPEDVELYIKAGDAPCPSHRVVPYPKYVVTESERGNGNLKERFVESLQEPQDSKPPSKVKAKEKTTKKHVKEEDKGSLAAVLKKGGRGRPVQLYENAVTFKDRSLLEESEYLDLACGPPVSSHKTPAQLKRIHALEAIALEDKTKLSGQHPKVPKLDFAASAKSSGLVSKETRDGRSRKPKSSSGTKREPSTPAKSQSQLEGPPPSPSSVLRTPVSKSSGGSKSPALTGRRADLKTEATAGTDVTKLSPDELLVAFEQHDSKRCVSSVTHFTPEEEEQYVKRLVSLRKELQTFISSGEFVPARVLTVPPGSSRQLVVIMTPNGSTRPHVTTRTKRSEQRIFIKLLEYDQALLRAVMTPQNDFSELPVRDLVIRSSCVRSVLEVGQSSINFGTCERGEVKSRTIVIHNKSDCAGVFRMRTSGSIASGNLKLGVGRYGVVPAFGRKEVASFSFIPSMVGNYQETIVVENVLDSYNDQNVLVKATVRRMPAFSLDVTKIDFAPAQPGNWPAAAGFIITNTSKTERTFVVDVGAPEGAAFAELSVSRDEKDAGMALSKGEEEEVEAILQKLKIARRKNKPDKIAKYEKRLGELGITQAESTPTEEDCAVNDTPVGGDVSSTPSIAVTLGPSKKAKILVALIPRHGSEPFTTSIKVYERKNTDETVLIDVSASPQMSEAPVPTPSPPSSPEDPLHLAIMRHCLDLTLQCPVSQTAFCVGSTLFLPASSPMFEQLQSHFPTFDNPQTGKVAGLLLADGYSRQIPGNTHAEANALTNFRERMGKLADDQLPPADDILAQAYCFATMEPCSVRTSGGPSCALELVRAHVKAVYLGVEEPPDFVQCEGVRILEQGGVEVRRVVGLEEDCLRLARRGRS